MFSYKSLVEKFLTSSFYIIQLIGYFQRQRNHVFPSVKTNPLLVSRKLKDEDPYINTVDPIYNRHKLKIDPCTLNHTKCKTPEKSNFLKNDKMIISLKIQNFSRSRMMKQTSPLEFSHKI